MDLGDLRRATGAEIDGDIGYNFLKHFAVTLDYPAGLLHLAPERDSEAVASEGVEVAFRLGAPAKPLVLVEVAVNGSGPYQFAVDTGASTTLVSPALAFEASRRRRSPLAAGMPPRSPSAAPTASPSAR
jgi:hypothetical protein